MSTLRKSLAGAGDLATAALLLAACGGASPHRASSSSTSTTSSSASKTPASQRLKGGTATFALGPTATPDYIFPLMSTTYFTVANISNFQYFMYKPLYYFGVGDQPVLNTEQSIANPPTFSNGGKTVTVTLKHFVWSDGETVSATDVALWQNMVTAEKAIWAAGVPTGYPGNVVSTKVVNPTTIQFTFNKAYNHKWVVYNELSQVTPMPQAWDVTSLGAKPGSGGCATSVSKCAAVYNFLNTQAKRSFSTYASSPIWSVVDGPWKLESLSTNGEATFLANPKYAGPDKPYLSKFVELPFTTDTAEYSELRAGTSIDVGYIPQQDVKQAPSLTNYTFKPWLDFGFNYFTVNLNNPTVGPIFRQTYFRQVLEELIDQTGDIHAFYAGYGNETCGPVPTVPPNPLASAYAKSCPYSFNVAKAKATLKAHGWDVVPGGTDTCARPGTGSDECGAGITKGQKLEFQYVYATGLTSFTNTVETEKSDSARAGVTLNLKGTTFDQSVAIATICTPKQSSCSWQIANHGGGWVYSPDYYPTGEELFSTGAGSNTANYSNAKMDSLINDSTLAAGNPQGTLNAYQNYAVDQLPVIYQAQPDYQLNMINKKLHGFSFNSYLNIIPSLWYFTK